MQQARAASVHEVVRIKILREWGRLLRGSRGSGATHDKRKNWGNLFAFAWLKGKATNRFFSEKHNEKTRGTRQKPQIEMRTGNEENSTRRMVQHRNPRGYERLWNSSFPEMFERTQQGSVQLKITQVRCWNASLLNLLAGKPQTIS